MTQSSPPYTRVKVIRVLSEHFVVGLVIRGGCVLNAGEMMRYMIGWPEQKVRNAADGQGWTVD